MRAYKPNTPFNVPLQLLIPEIYEDSLGVRKKKYTPNGQTFYGSFRTFGGTDTVVDGVLSVQNTAVIETWFNPSIKSNCEILVIPTGVTYDIIGNPENIDMRNQYMKIRVIATKGGA